MAGGRILRGRINILRNILHPIRGLLRRFHGRGKDIAGQSDIIILRNIRHPIRGGLLRRFHGRGKDIATLN
jgi:hypothetical protein